MLHPTDNRSGGESYSAAPALAPASAGANADADHVSATCRGDERRLSLEEETVQRTRARTLEKLVVAPCPERAIGTAGPTGSKDCEVNHSS
jgi:hypothetical protein